MGCFKITFTINYNQMILKTVIIYLEYECLHWKIGLKAENTARWLYQIWEVETQKKIQKFNVTWTKTKPPKGKYLKILNGDEILLKWKMGQIESTRFGPQDLIFGQLVGYIGTPSSTSNQTKNHKTLESSF